MCATVHYHPITLTRVWTVRRELQVLLECQDKLVCQGRWASLGTLEWTDCRVNQDELDHQENQ